MSLLCFIIFYIIFVGKFLSNYLIFTILISAIFIFSIMFIFVFLAYYIMAKKSLALYFLHKKSDCNLLILLFKIFIRDTIKEFKNE